jgi:hypothetical protein
VCNVAIRARSCNVALLVGMLLLMGWGTGVLRVVAGVLVCLLVWCGTVWRLTVVARGRPSCTLVVG